MLFEFGAFGPLKVREESARLGLPRRQRVLYASDLHLGHAWTKRVPDRLIEVVRGTRPNVLMLGGDLVDNSSALSELVRLVAALADSLPVCAIPGNHDQRVGTQRVRDTICSNGGQWLPGSPLSDPLRIDGVIDPHGTGPRILCAHDPSVFPDAEAAGYPLVFSGHLHGGQCVFSNRGGKQYPAVWFNRWHGLNFEERSSRMLVSRGVADSFPFRFNCPREVILCEID